jgi:hypothetical protein
VTAQSPARPLRAQIKPDAAAAAGILFAMHHARKAAAAQGRGPKNDHGEPLPPPPISAAEAAAISIFCTLGAAGALPGCAAAVAHVGRGNATADPVAAAALPCALAAAILKAVRAAALADAQLQAQRAQRLTSEFAAETLPPGFKLHWQIYGMRIEGYMVRDAYAATCSHGTRLIVHQSALVSFLKRHGECRCAHAFPTCFPNHRTEHHQQVSPRPAFGNCDKHTSPHVSHRQHRFSTWL